jgi:hypothetical protein
MPAKQQFTGTDEALQLVREYVDAETDEAPSFGGLLNIAMARLAPAAETVPPEQRLAIRISMVSLIGVCLIELAGVRDLDAMMHHWHPRAKTERFQIVWAEQQEYAERGFAEFQRWYGDSEGQVKH